jgi:Tol biopolymer transport system component
VLAVSIASALTFASLASAKHFSAWGVPVNAELIPGTSSELNTPFNDGCPIQSPDGLSLFIATNRPGGLGGQDIWVARRESKDAPWGAPEPLGEPVNSSANDFCPSPVPGHGLFFVSERAGGGDIFFTRFKDGAWEEPQNLGNNINSPFGEASPSYFEDESGHAVLYFSSQRPGGFEPGGTDSDIYFSVDFGPAQLAPGLNTAVHDFRPNVRKDGREIVFDSNRVPGSGGQDIWTASRETTADDWTSPTNLGPLINSEANETRASLSRDGLTMVFGSNRPGSEGMADVYVTTREKLVGRN